MRVLVVEDEDTLGEVFRDFLAEIGHDAVVVRSAEAALGALQRQLPDAILLDINLPGMSGLDFLQLRPVREAGLPIVAISGVATETQARECLRLGALDFVGKPVPLERLNELLTVMEPHALTRRPTGDPAPSERRRGPRAAIGFSWAGAAALDTVSEASAIDPVWELAGQLTLSLPVDSNWSLALSVAAGYAHGPRYKADARTLASLGGGFGDAALGVSWRL